MSKAQTRRAPDTRCKLCKFIRNAVIGKHASEITDPLEELVELPVLEQTNSAWKDSGAAVGLCQDCTHYFQLWISARVELHLQTTGQRSGRIILPNQAQALPPVNLSKERR